MRGLCIARLTAIAESARISATLRRLTGPSESCLALMLLGCVAHRDVSTSEVADRGSPMPPAIKAEVHEVPFACEQGATSNSQGLKRLTMTQYRNTVIDLVHWVVKDADKAEQVIDSARLDDLPIDRRQPTATDPHGSFRRLDQAVDQAHVDETFRVASSLAAALTSQDLLSATVGSCATDNKVDNDESCLFEFIRRFGARALRMPLEAEDEQFYRVVYGSDPTSNRSAYADVITVMLSAPEFFYFVEHGDEEIKGEPGAYQLTSYELALRLSYHFWQTLPDDQLWHAAEDGSLLMADVYEKQVKRLMRDSRARETINELFADLLGLDDLPALDVHNEDPRFVAFAGDDLPSAALRDDVVQDALGMLGYYTWTKPAALEALFTSELSFAQSKELAHIYGVKPWNGQDAPPPLPEGQRAGLLSRAWFLMSGSANTRPIVRGVFVRRQLLCDELAPPPSNVAAMPPELSAEQTTRQVVEELTEQPGTACASCHATFINPLGFAFEGFDALGRVRAHQRLFAEDGTEVGELAIDTMSVPRVDAEDERTSTGPADLVRLLLNSGKLEACLARNYFRFTFGRFEDLDADGCALEQLRARLVESKKLREMIAEAAWLSEFQQRRFEP